ncbi:MAG: rhamnulokinase [Armatimonadota bacterium]
MKLLAIDLGASGGRVLAATLSGTGSGHSLELSEAHRFPHGPIPLPRAGGVTYCWDAVLLWSEVLSGLRKAGHEHGRVESVGVDTWGVDFGLLDRQGGLLANPVSYRDSRTDGMMELAFSRVSRDEIFRRTGLQFMPLNTLYQLLALKEQDSPTLPLVERMLLIPDLLHYWLCGSETVEYTNASTTQMLDSHSRSWDLELLRRLEVPHSFLPEIVPEGSRLGRLRAVVADETGLSTRVQVICPATHDTGSAVVATPGEGADWAFLSAGTWCLFGAEVDRPYLDPAVLEAGFSNEGGVRGTTRLLRNITGLWLVQECRRYWASQGESYSYADLAALAAGARPFAAVLDPDDPGFAQPTRMPHAIADYCRRTGQAVPEGPGELVRVAMEGIALTVRRRWEQLQRILGRRLSVLHIVGGGTQNTLLCQLIANALGCPVLAGPTEATAMGNALVQAVGLGALDYSEARQVVRRSVTLAEYRPEETGAWDEAYGRYLALFEPKG